MVKNELICFLLMGEFSLNISLITFIRRFNPTKPCLRLYTSFVKISWKRDKFTIPYFNFHDPLPLGEEPRRGSWDS